MFAQINRLRKKADLERVFKAGIRFKEGFLLLKIVNNGLKNGRFGFVVGQKVSKKAVVRNRIKRKLRELLRVRLPKIKKGVDAVIIVLPGAGTKNIQQMEGMVDNLLRKARIFNG